LYLTIFSIILFYQKTACLAIFRSSIQISISRRAFIRSSIGGWVIKNVRKPFPLKGLAIYKWAVAVEAVFIRVLSAAIFSRARAKPSGYLVKRAPVASAKNSLFREIAN